MSTVYNIDGKAIGYVNDGKVTEYTDYGTGKRYIGRIADGKILEGESERLVGRVSDWSIISNVPEYDSGSLYDGKISSSAHELVGRVYDCVDYHHAGGAGLLLLLRK